MTDDDVAKIGALFEAFRAEERAGALAGAQKMRITFTRNLGSSQTPSCMTGLEAVVDQDASTEEIYEVLARFDAALDRHKAKIDLGEHYFRIDQKLREMETAIRNRAEREVQFRVDNDARNAYRRVPITLTDQQSAELRNFGIAIKDCRDRISELWVMAAEAKMILGGEANPFDLLEKSLIARQETVFRPAA